MTELERLQGIIADAQAQIDALPRVQTVKEEARERFAVECETDVSVKYYRSGRYDDHPQMIAMTKVVQELRDAQAEIAELKARDTKPVLIDPDRPLEAYHPDGRVVDVEFHSAEPGGNIWIKPHFDVLLIYGGSASMFKLTGEHHTNDSDWRIRNKAVQS